MPSPPVDSKTAADLDTLARAVGLLVLQWGQAEQALDLMVAMLWQSLGGKKHAKKIPVMLEPKLKFLRTCVAAEPLLRTDLPIANDIFDRFESLASIRHDLIHGAVASISPVNNELVFAKLDVKDGFHHHREVRISSDEYPKIVDRLVKLGNEVNALNQRVFNLVRTHKAPIR